MTTQEWPIEENRGEEVISNVEPPSKHTVQEWLEVAPTFGYERHTMDGARVHMKWNEDTVVTREEYVEAIKEYLDSPA